MSLGQAIRYRRLQLGLTQEQLAGHLSKSFISQLEGDKTQPSLATLQILAHRLEISIDELLHLSNSSPDPRPLALSFLEKAQFHLHGGDYDRATTALRQALACLQGPRHR
ncbi:MAG: helix-turn-helix domain-containing protein [Limnochordia bacterium]|jgi:transcriptional regulator with XRE-family HTH domain